MKTIRLLLIEDNNDDVEILRCLFNKIQEFRTVITNSESLSYALELVKHYEYDIVILNISLPDNLGYETFKVFHNAAPMLPVIIMTGCEDRKLLETTIQEGAQDYIIKDKIEPYMLKQTIIHSIERQRMVKSLEFKTNEIEMLKESLLNLINNNADGMIVIDKNSNILFVNHAACRIFNKNENELIGAVFQYKINLNNSTDIEISNTNYGITVAELRAVPFLWEEEQAYLISIRDVTKRVEAENRIRDISYHDTLTGLYNRNYFDEQFRILNASEQLPISMIIGDVNNLKVVNDVFGHATGDLYLKKIAKIIKNSCRKDDIIARIGGDEFVIILFNCTEEAAKSIINKITEKCKETKVEEIPVSIALGAAAKDFCSDDMMGDIFKLAEERMYKNKTIEYKNSRASLLDSLLNHLIAKNYLSLEHINRTKDQAIRFAEYLNLKEDVVDQLTVLINFHDIGNIIVPEYILKKRSKLDGDEWETIKKHTETGYRMIKTFKDMEKVADAILAHHERWDGEGYPLGLKAEQIPFISRICSIVDTFECLTNNRPYREALSSKEAIDELRRNVGTQFDPILTEKFLNFLETQGVSVDASARLNS